MTDLECFLTTIARVLQLPPERVTADTALLAVAPDSLALVEALIDIQDEFGVILHQHDFANIKTVGQVAQLVAQRLSV
jgi:acyl carrier protein